MQVFGHRGAAGHAPENTLAGIAAAIDMGVDWVEVDVQSVEGELVLFHDDTLDRTTNGTGALADIRLRTLRQLDAGDGERVPTLAEALAFIDARVGLNLELKGAQVWQPTLALVRAALGVNLRWHERLLLTSFHPDQTAALAAQPRAGWLLGVLFDDAPSAALARARALDAWSIHPSRAQVDADFVARAHAQGRKVIVYTVNEPADIARMRALAVDGVFSDYPDRVIAQCSEGGAARMDRS